ncbi:hypothetical protein [Streptomyces zaomyceticus]|uniref:hypothetical protein n=1 Tax=Streptomyces zaomyceticus TaxID=68286 RepID=UPI002E0DD4C3|nr:hypothetical protein OG237_15825 [Streptomyces zaomyceticus]
MPFGRRETSETTSSSTPTKRLRRTMPTRFEDGDPRAAGHETTQQPSRGGWFPEPAKPIAGTPKSR